ncbi:hypothetical protein D3C73_663820 [compost metagenome]
MEFAVHVQYPLPSISEWSQGDIDAEQSYLFLFPLLAPCLNRNQGSFHFVAVQERLVELILA